MVNEGYLAIPSKFEKLITSLRTAYATECSLNKEQTSFSDSLDARPHEVTLLKIKHIRIREKYGKGEIPHEVKTGTGPILLTCSLPYVRDWVNDLNNGSPITSR
jgi:hypothetical protein